MGDGTFWPPLYIRVKGAILEDQLNKKYKNETEKIKDIAKIVNGEDYKVSTN